MLQNIGDLFQKAFWVILSNLNFRRIGSLFIIFLFVSCITNKTLKEIDVVISKVSISDGELNQYRVNNQYVFYRSIKGRKKNIKLSISDDIIEYIKLYNFMNKNRPDTESDYVMISIFTESPIENYKNDSELLIKIDSMLTSSKEIIIPDNPLLTDYFDLFAMIHKKKDSISLFQNKGLFLLTELALNSNFEGKYFYKDKIDEKLDWKIGFNNLSLDKTALIKEFYLNPDTNDYILIYDKYYLKYHVNFELKDMILKLKN